MPIMLKTTDYLTIKEASLWATNYLGKEVTTSNISYLIQYGRISKIGHNGSTQILKEELERYYASINKSMETVLKEKLGQDLNWTLSFDNLKEADTTKHIHRLHPYKGKFIPQLVEYFLDAHIDKFKTEKYFNKGNIVLDPFCGSGTTLAQSSELGIHAVGIDVSSFNAFISNCKIADYDIKKLEEEIKIIKAKLEAKVKTSKVDEFEDILIKKLKNFNDKYFPVPKYKYKLRQNLINEDKYGAEKEKLFLPVYEKLISEYKIELLKKSPKTFIEKWKTYSKDTVSRLKEFSKLKTNTFQYCLTGDSRTIDIFSALSKKQKDFAALAQKQKISGIFSSPHYVGLIDYHEQHAYAYDLFGFERNDELEIGPLFKGQTKDAQTSYIEGISSVLNNCKKYLKKDYNIFFVANDKYNLYPQIADNSGMKIVNQFKRPVLNRTEKDKGAYSEIIFHLKQAT